ncbi:MAG: TrmH family RNA methyltransferase [Beijerinckiaceae bacterium]
MATPEPVTDPGDPRLEPFLAVRERDLAGRQGRFVAEGEVVLRVLLAADRFAIETILVSDRVADGGRDWFAAVPADAAFLRASDAVIERASGFHVHRGILAVGRRREAQDAASLLAGLPGRALVVVCVGIANHDNMGGIFRNGAAFGADAVLCDSTCCDPLYRKAIRVSVGGVFRVPFARGGTAERIVGDLAESGFTCVALSPAGAEPIHRMERPDRLALVLGTEGEGLPASLMAQLRTARIDMASGFDSLNVAMSAGIALHWAFNR